MKCILEAQKLVRFGDGICGKTEKDFDANRRKKKDWNTEARRRRMMKKIQEKPEKFISNFGFMKTHLGPKETDRAIMDGIKDIFKKAGMSTTTLFEKDCSKRKSAELKGTLIVEFTVQ